MTVPERPRRVQLGWVGLTALCLAALAVILTLRTTGALARLASGNERTRVTHDVALGRMEAVGKLVTSETGLRDVVVYENTRFGSTKRSLIVVTGKALAGIDLKDRARVDIDEKARRITLTVPHARLLGVVVTELRTYDERSGLWNWFHPDDRDTIFTLARQRLTAAARDLQVLSHAERSARQLLSALFATDGYAVDVVFVPFLAPPPAN